MSPPEWSGDFQHLQACTRNCGNFYLSKLTHLQGSLDTAMSVPLGLPCQVPLEAQKAPFFFVSPKHIIYPSAHRTGVRQRGKLAAGLCILAVDNFSESELQQGKDSLTAGVFSQLPAGWGWWDPILLIFFAMHPQHLRILVLWAWLKKF